MRPLVRVLFSWVLAGVFLAAPTPDRASAASGAPLPLDRFGDIVADPAHNHVFVSGGKGVDGVVVTDADGAVEQTLRGLPGAAGMVLTPDATTLYVALASGAAIVAIDTDDLSRRTFPLRSDACPRALALAAGSVWFSADCNDIGHTSLGALDPESGDVHDDVLGGAPALLAAVPARPDMLLVAGGGLLSRFTVTGGAVPTATEARTRAVGGLNDMKITPDGKQVVVAGDGAEHHQVLDTENLGFVGAYPSQRSAVAVALRADGTVGLGTKNDRLSDAADVFVYAPGQTTYAERRDLGTVGANGNPRWVLPGGMAFGSRRLYVVSSPERDGAPTLHVFTPDPPKAPALGTRSLKVPDVYQVLADRPRHRAFLSTGFEGNGVLMVDSHGRLRKVFQHFPGATQMSLNGGGTTLYVALATGDQIAAIDLATLAVRRFPTGAASCPDAATTHDGLVWFSSGCPITGEGRWVGALNPRTGQVYRTLSHLVPSLLYSSGMQPQALYGLTWDAAQRLEVTAGADPQAGQGTETFLDGSPEDLAFSPDGLHISAATKLEDNNVLDAATLAPVAVAPPDNAPVAVATRSDGLTAYGNENEVLLRRSALGGVLATVTLPTTLLTSRGLAFGNRQLFSVGRTLTGFKVIILPMPAPRVLTLTTDRAIYTTGERAQIVAHVAPSATGAHKRVTVYATPAGGSRQLLLANAHPDPFGNVRTSKAFTRDVRISAVLHTTRGTWKAAINRPVD